MKIFEIIRSIYDRIPLYRQQFITVVEKEGLLKAVMRVFKKVFKFVISGGNSARLRKLQYIEWMGNIESKYLNLENMQKEYSKLANRPKFSIVFPVWNKSEDMLEKALDSIVNQVYTNWEICISDGSTEYVDETREFLEDFRKKYSSKVKISTIDIQGINILENSNNAIDMATGKYLVFMDCDDEISTNCLLELAKSINEHPDVEFLYSDFDKIEEKGNRYDPSFWPDWSPHTLTAQMYTTHVTCYRRDIVKELGGLVKGTEGAQDWDLALRYVTRGNWKVVHIPKILYHWRVYIDSTALANGGSKSWAYDNQRTVLRRYLERRGLKGEVLEGPYRGAWRVRLDIIGNPKISIVVPTCDKVDYLKRAIDSIKDKTEYGNYEIVVVNNNSEKKETLEYFKDIEREKNIKVIDYNKPFHFGKLYNWSSKQIDGEYMLMLNNDTEALNKGWLKSMLEWCQLPEVGSVGAKLYYKSGKIQHAGVIVGAGGAAAHSHRLSDGDDFGYEGAIVNIRDYLAVTGACVMIERKVFLDMGGFDEQFNPAYQDVDLGIRLYEKGLYNVYTPYAELTHYESISRFDEKNRVLLRTDEECAKILTNKWPQYIKKDPFYNPNLSKGHEDYRLRIN